jgi:3-deoxy-manno-octulosonate cytidylyltransferase (CMP-KDO synthetase)
MEICFCIPARYRSSRLDKKLLMKIGELTCIERTIIQTLKSKYAKSNLYVLTDSEDIIDVIKDYDVHVILTTSPCVNGTDRISKHLDQIPKNYKHIVNVQADEPFISPANIDHAVELHMKYGNEDRVFYTTLHEESNTDEYLKSTASLKLVLDNDNRVLYYSRNIIPWNKKGVLSDYVYKTFTGIYVFNRDYLTLYKDMENTNLQMEEDCEQLKILENNYVIKSYPTIEYNEISMNTPEDYDYLQKTRIE